MASDHRARLEELQHEAQRRVHETAEVLDTLTTARRSENDDDEHDPEGVTLSTEWSRLAGVHEAAEQELALIEQALARVQAGTYGICASCGQPIPEARLEVRPFAERCVSCAEKLGL